MGACSLVRPSLPLLLQSLNPGRRKHANHQSRARAPPKKNSGFQLFPHRISIRTIPMGLSPPRLQDSPLDLLNVSLLNPAPSEVADGRSVGRSSLSRRRLSHLMDFPAGKRRS